MAAGRWADEAIDRRRLSFGAAAEHYDRVRPAYPQDLVDDAIAYAGQELTSTGRALEVGAGTGKATLQFASRGLRIDAIEPDEAMAVVARRRLASAGVAVALQASDFESANVADHAYGLLYAAQAWHWIPRAPVRAGGGGADTRWCGSDLLELARLEPMRAP